MGVGGGGGGWGSGAEWDDMSDSQSWGWRGMFHKTDLNAIVCLSLIFPALALSCSIYWAKSNLSNGSRWNASVNYQLLDRLIFGHTSFLWNGILGVGWQGNSVWGLGPREGDRVRSRFALYSGSPRGRCGVVWWRAQLSAQALRFTPRGLTEDKTHCQRFFGENLSKYRVK